jgi:hypothetical protein
MERSGGRCEERKEEEGKVNEAGWKIEYGKYDKREREKAVGQEKGEEKFWQKCYEAIRNIKVFKRL